MKLCSCSRSDRDSATGPDGACIRRQYRQEQDASVLQLVQRVLSWRKPSTLGIAEQRIYDGWQRQGFFQPDTTSQETPFTMSM
ncbi:hypothetical protein WJX84_010585 [Apatococcus fuscideae]|uniref:Uncharacterized protein n=1 Tax=Apatococcus fuscideae TaxID=2026836 RepID=A0AAW1STD1_9CHLO